MRVPFIAAALGFALAEAVMAGHAAWLGELSLSSSAIGAAASGLVMLGCAGVVLWAIDALSATRGARTLMTGLRRALAGGGSLTFAWLWGCAWLAVATLALLGLASSFMAHMSPRFGLLLSVLASFAGTALSLLCAAASGQPIGRRIVPASDRARAIDRVLPVPVLGLAAALSLGLFVEPRYAPAPIAAAGLCAAALAGRFGRVRVPGRRVWLVLALGVACLAALEVIPRTAAYVVAYRTPYASLALGLGQRLFDRDGDGASTWLLGGDCNDRDPAIHPRARDIPDNSIDENCSGSDAPVYERPRPEPTGPSSAPSEPHDIVVLMVDALRPDRLSLSGYRRNTSPHLDALAREGTWFRNAYTTAPSTRFAMASLFTGRDVRRLRYQDTGGNNFRLLPGAPTLARRLKADGYRTVGYTVTYVVQHNKGLGQGFDHWATPWPLSEWRTVGAKKAEITTGAVLEELERTPHNERLFLFAHYYCTHAPYYEYPPHDFGDSPSDLYDAGIAHCDEQIGRVLDALRKRPSWNRTAVFVVSDHGELFGEHGLTSHGNSLYEPDVRVTLIARVPQAPPRIVDTPVQLHWVAPTVFELATLRPRPEDDAVSLLPAIVGTRGLQARPLYLFTELERGSVRFFSSAVLDWPYKFIRDHRTGALALYDVAKDTREKHSLVQRKPTVAGRLADLLEAYEAWALP